jgi:putative ABC transport system substrate-binding protein
VRRRDFIALLGGTATWTVAARAQQSERVRRIGVLNILAETDPEAQAWDVAFRKRLDELEWINGRNIQIEYQWGAESVDHMASLAKELVRSKPDVTCANTIGIEWVSACNAAVAMVDTATSMPDLER